MTETGDPEDGFVVAWKPPGLASAALVSRLKKKTGRKAGHTGTLDRFAEGLMILLCGRGTAFADLFLKQDKSYEVAFRFGRSTDTLDPQGRVLEEWPSDRVTEFLQQNEQVVRAAIESLTAQTEQTPPEYSAIKREGERLSDRVRRGIADELPVRSVKIYEARCLELHSGEGLVRAFFAVSSGTYIRSMARDLSLQLGIPIHVQTLKRLTVGAYSSAHPLLWRDLESPPKLIPLLDAFSWPRVVVSSEAEKAIRNGLVRGEVGCAPGDFFFVSEDGRLLAWACGDGKSYSYRRVFC